MKKDFYYNCVKCDCITISPIKINGACPDCGEIRRMGDTMTSVLTYEKRKQIENSQAAKLLDYVPLHELEPPARCKHTGESLYHTKCLYCEHEDEISALKKAHSLQMDVATGKIKSLEAKTEALQNEIDAISYWEE